MTLNHFRPQAKIVQDWRPALNGVFDKLRAGAKVADVGSGHGPSTILMVIIGSSTLMQIKGPLPGRQYFAID